MARYTRFCIRCGKLESDDRPLIAGLCPECYVEIHGLAKVLHPVQIVYCPKCYSMKISGRWIRPVTSDEFYSLLRTLVMQSLQPATRDIAFMDIVLGSIEMYSTSLEIEITASISNKAIVKHRLSIPVTWQKQLCPTCFKRAGGSYEAVVQLRFINFSQDIEEFKNWLTEIFPDDIVEIDEHKHGYDIKVSSPFIAKKIADLAKRRWNCVKIVESYGEQRRRRDGRRYGKLYISVRILNFKPGDYVVLNNRAYTVESVNDKEIVVVDSSGHRKRVNLRDVVKMYTRT